MPREMLVVQISSHESSEVEEILREDLGDRIVNFSGEYYGES
jgi:hypothetical protein